MQLTQTHTDKQEHFKIWVRDYSDLLYSYAIMKGFDHDEAKDLVQDTFLSAWRGMDGFEGKASVKNWLFVILKNKITDHFRQRINNTKVDIFQSGQDLFDEDGHWAKGSYPKELAIDPSSAADQTDFQQILDSCSNKLNKIQKAVFLMKYIDDMESENICIELAITSNNYWTLLHRAKVQIRACLEKNWLMTRSV